MDIRYYDIEFTKAGLVYDAAQAQRLLYDVPQLTDLLVLSHGWNNGKAEASELYANFFDSVTRVMGTGTVSGLDNRTFGALRIYWPSKKFVDAELSPGGGAASATQANDDALMQLLEHMKLDPVRLGGKDIDPVRAANLDAAQALVPLLETDAAARRDFVFRLRAILDASDAHPDDGSMECFERDPEQLFDGLKAAARRLANYTTYYEMKQRAGVVGHTGVAQVLMRARDRKPELRLHLIGHSFGGRLVTAAAHTLPPGTPNVTISLLQAAYSHNGLGQNYDGEQHDGAFRALLGERRASGPIVITHTKNDRAVGIAYPLASRISRQKAAALGDQDDPYGGMGRNGAQHTPEVDTGAAELLAVGPAYAFAPGRVYNLSADQFISGHSDVTGPQVAYAVLNAVRTV
jgi:hypothetical protein